MTNPIHLVVGANSHTGVIGRIMNGQAIEG
jgi:hypothetical protein